ncbi:MAG: DUF370 domain-containing protein [Clostridia bacterium]|jgi:hypothetical protein|nr:DUF370 domain-containing protein [Clostridia bacterium]MBO7397590.1 DUF370 domain-containing protein [Clostridia bacterium]MBO7658446.1 DUF370 domain-containing protein [Clostridia bacterium]MBP5666372.1 DUF370 domain-containing protein [Clostridia bacterium]MBP5766740.1 DUF370 domain-containing protein [Clostridia bacterium]
MYIHIGDDIGVLTKKVIGIFNLENSTIGPVTRKFLKDAEDNNLVTNTSSKIPKAFVLTDGPDGVDVYLTSNNAETIFERMRTGTYTKE